MVNYFGVPLASSNLSAKLIQKTKAKALFLYAIRNENDGFTMHIEPMDEKIYEGTADDGTYVIHQAIEQLIYQYPEHYHWSYKRFKANPALDNIYNIDPTEALKIVDRLKAEALKPLLNQSLSKRRSCKTNLWFSNTKLKVPCSKVLLAEYAELLNVL